MWRIADSGEISNSPHTGDQRTHAFNCGHSLAAFIPAEEPLDGQVILVQAIIDEPQTFADLYEQLAHHSAESVFPILEVRR